MKDKLGSLACLMPTQLVHGSAQILITLLSGHDLHVAFRLMRGRRKREHLKAFGMGRPMREWWTTNDEVDRGPLYGRSEMKMSFGVGWMNVSASLPHVGKTCAFS